MTILRPLICVAVLATGAVSCTPKQASSLLPTASPSAQSAAEAIEVAVPEVTRVITITEDNDANNLIGRPTGYIAETILVDSRVTDGCDTAKPGIDCGAGVEQWPDQQAAQKRADYIKNVDASMAFLGSEYHTIKKNLLLRVSGKLKPSAAQAYQAAFTA